MVAKAAAFTIHCWGKRCTRCTRSEGPTCLETRPPVRVREEVLPELADFNELKLLQDKADEHLKGFQGGRH